MYKIGKIPCSECMNENIEQENDFAYLIQAQNDLAIGIRKNQYGHYKAECLSPGRQEQISFIKRPKTKNGLFLSGKVRVISPSGKKSVYSLDITNRICRYCYENGTINYLPFSAGYYPALVFAVVGEKSAGKSALINAIKYSLSGEDRLKAAKTVDASVKLDPNQLADRVGMSEEFFVYDKKKRPICTVMLLDTPGELVSGAQRTENNKGEDYEFHRNRIDMADGVIYVIEPQGGEGVKGDNNNLWLDMLANYEENNPIAIVMTKSDQVKDVCEEAGGILRKEGREKPVLTKDYFTFQQEMKEKSFKQKVVHMLRDKAVMCDLAPVLLGIQEDRKNVGYFFVSSGRPAGDDETRIQLEYSVNVTEPMKYLLAINGLYQYETKEIIDE